VLVFSQASRATQVAVNTSGHVPLVTTPTNVTVTLVPLHASEAAGRSKLQTLPHSTVLLVAQVSTGGVMSRTVTTWLQLLLLPHASTARHVRVINCGHEPLVTVLRTLTVTLVPPHVSEAPGASKLQTLAHSTVLLVAQVSTGRVMSRTVTTWLQLLLLPHASTARQVRVINCGHVPLVTVLRTLTVTLVPLQVSDTPGASKLQALPHSAVLLVAHVSTGGVVSTTPTVWLHCAVFPHASVARHVRVALKV